MNAEHPVEQPIRRIEVDTIPGEQLAYWVGGSGVTRIEACVKSGPYSPIPYVRVWKDDVCEAEFCQHNIVGVYFAVEPAPVEPTPEYTPAGGWPADHTGEASCRCNECIPF